MGTKSITIQFQNQTQTYQLGTNFNVMKYRANGDMKNKLIFDFFNTNGTNGTYQAQNAEEYKHLTSFLKVADKTGDGVIDDNDCVALDKDKNRPQELLTAYGEDAGSFISAYSDKTGGYIDISTFGL